MRAITNVASGVQAFTSNAFLVEGERTVLVDAGANFDVVGALEAHVDWLDGIVLTHTHPDHVGALADVKTAFDVEAWGYDPHVEGASIEHAIEDGETIRLGDHEYVALYTPGHKDDHLCLYADDPEILFAGDLVFQNGGFGRTDLPEGDRETLIESIDRVLERVDPSLEELHVGHGPSVTERPYEHVERAARMAREM